MNENLRWAWHPQRGRRQMPQLKPGWTWLDDVPTEQQVVTKLVKRPVRPRRIT